MYPLKEKRGQAILEYVLVTPLFLAAFLMVIDVGWVSYQRVLFDYTVRHASWEWRPSSDDRDQVIEDGIAKVYQGEDASTMLRKQMTEENELSGHLNLTDISVENARVYLYRDIRTQSYRCYNDSEYVRMGRMLNLETMADVNYIIRPLTPVGIKLLGDEIPIERSMYKIYNIQFRGGVPDND
ncbi:TadE family protein [Tindallia californiensis]|uniref:TadE-like protein n=1 Tax=Tindallia californiensis TaxID=159292 RepID=A0A1H3M7N3_9FIRM|nr:TadE family protein [Tindallia californiensis]SDY72035.1 TadE-like protein [Tindallia californiensis]